MVPGIVYRITGNAGGYPLLVNIVVGVPLMAAGNTAFVSPDETFGSKELVDVELQRLGGRNVLGVEINVVNKVVKLGNHCRVVNSLRREIPDDVIVPENVAERMCSANVMVG